MEDKETKPYQSKVRFESTSGVSLHSIPDTENLQDIDLTDKNKVWHGSIDFIEQEQLVSTHMDGFEQTKYDKFIIHPFLKLRSKLEFKNGDKLWGETWYVPTNLDLILFNKNSSNGNDIDIRRITKLSNDGKDSIEKITDNTFKVIVQLPDSGFHPYYTNHDPENLTQIALGLKFKDSRKAAQFDYILSVFQAKYRHEQQSYYYDRMVYAVNIINFKTVMNEHEEDDDNEDEDDVISAELTDEELDDKFSNLSIMSKLRHDFTDEDDKDEDEDDFGEFIST
ncbi:hypothetical protein SBY92_003892 [Candida maltosa Xu316]|uniref:Uncharacterized protein n=1 Tax=Candida maltosa (strain Xu316) TaxID=1245528 RepID=M3K020_CANMX|nr:hypothetical protein G210_0799 [Candida maltosa Xu316]